MNGISINAGQKRQDDEDSDDIDEKEKSKQGSFDDISDGVGSDQEIAVSAGIHQLNQARNNQADKNIFKQERDPAFNMNARSFVNAPEVQAHQPPAAEAIANMRPE